VFRDENQLYKRFVIGYPIRPKSRPLFDYDTANAPIEAVRLSRIGKPSELAW
jgi:hypothetical protein